MSMQTYEEHPADLGAATPPLRILYLMEGLELGGAERRFVTLAGKLDRTRFHPIVGTLRPGGILERDVRALRIPLEAFPRHARFDPSPVVRLARYVAAQRVDVIHAMYWLSNLVAMLAAWRLPHVAVVGSTGGMVYNVRRHGNYRLALDHLVWRRMDQMTVNAIVMRDYLTQRGFPADRLTVIPNGVAVPPEERLSPAVRAAARAWLGVAPDAPVVGIVARLDPLKDHPTFLRAAKRIQSHFPSARFVIVGGGAERASLEALTANLGLGDAVVFTGEIPTSDLALPAFDVCVLSSRSEGMPNALLEAGAWALPLVSTRAGGAAEIVVDGQNGFLVPIGDAAALADRVCALLGHPDQARRMGHAARALVATHFSTATMVRAYEQVYHSANAARRETKPN